MEIIEKGLCNESLECQTVKLELDAIKMGKRLNILRSNTVGEKYAL